MKYSIISLCVIAILTISFVFWHQSTIETLALKQQCAADGRKYINSKYGSEADLLTSVHFVYATDLKSCLIEVTGVNNVAAQAGIGNGLFQYIYDIYSGQTLATYGINSDVLIKLENKYFPNEARN